MQYILCAVCLPMIPINPHGLGCRGETVPQSIGSSRALIQMQQALADTQLGAQACTRMSCKQR